MKQVTFLNTLCNIEFTTYANNGRTAIQLYDVEDGCPMATATVNIPEFHLEPNEVLIKDYAENQGMLEALVKAGIVRETGGFAPSGFIIADVAELLVDPNETD